MKTESSAPSEDSLRSKRRSFLAGLVATGLLYATPVLLCVNEAEAHSPPRTGAVAAIPAAAIIPGAATTQAQPPQPSLAPSFPPLPQL